MSELVALLCNILRAEYSQFMRYTFISALKFGPFADELIDHLTEHAGDELEHASVVRRWIVDLGGKPPTDMEPVEPFNGTLQEALEWLLEAEIAGVNKYQMANELAHGIVGLQTDIGDLLSAEHEHLSDLFRWLEPQPVAEDIEPVVIVLASQYKKFASNVKLFKRFANVKKYADNVRDYIKQVLEMAWYKFGEDYTYGKGKQYLLDDSQKTIERLWEQHKTGKDVRDALKFYTDLYKQTSTMSDKQWASMHEWVWPDYAEWLGSDVQEEAKSEEKPTFPQIMEQVEPELAKPTPVKPEAPKVEIPKQVQPTLTKSVEFPHRKEAPERQPIEEAGKMFVYDVGKSRTGLAPTIEVGSGDKVKNMTLEGPEIPGPGRPGRAKHTEGVIETVTSDGLLLVSTGVGKQEWDPQIDLIEVDSRDREKIISKQPQQAAD